MVLVGFLWVWAMMIIALILMTLISYAWPDSLAGKVFATIK